MPCIETKVNVKLTDEQKNSLKTKFGKAIELLPGKSESWLMLSFEDECELYFKGSNEQRLAFVEVKIFGKASSDAYAKLTAEITDILNKELGISPACIYIKYEETAHWGWNGSNL